MGGKGGVRLVREPKIRKLRVSESGLSGESPMDRHVGFGRCGKSLSVLVYVLIKKSTGVSKCVCPSLRMVVTSVSCVREHRH